jgi:hypothetical protein
MGGVIIEVQHRLGSGAVWRGEKPQKCELQRYFGVFFSVIICGANNSQMRIGVFDLYKSDTQIKNGNFVCTHNKTTIFGAF